jgi:hypothetical protein
MMISRYYGSIPNLNWLPGLTLAGLAVVGGHRRPQHQGPDRPQARHRAGGTPCWWPVMSSWRRRRPLLGAIFAGAYGGVAAWALAERGHLTVAEQNLVRRSPASSARWPGRRRALAGTFVSSAQTAGRTGSQEPANGH